MHVHLRYESLETLLPSFDLGAGPQSQSEQEGALPQQEWLEGDEPMIPLSTAGSQESQDDPSSSAVEVSSFAAQKKHEFLPLWRCCTGAPPAGDSAGDVSGLPPVPAAPLPSPEQTAAADTPPRGPSRPADADPRGPPRQQQSTLKGTAGRSKKQQQRGPPGGPPGARARERAAGTAEETARAAAAALDERAEEVSQEVGVSTKAQGRRGEVGQGTAGESEETNCRGPQRQR